MIRLLNVWPVTVWSVTVWPGTAHAIWQYGAISLKCNNKLLNLSSKVFFEATSASQKASHVDVSRFAKWSAQRTKNQKNLPPPIHNKFPTNERMLSFEEYTKKLPSLVEYMADNKEMVSSDERGSAEEKLKKGYECYTKMAYETYKSKFFPYPNALWKQFSRK